MHVGLAKVPTYWTEILLEASRYLILVKDGDLLNGVDHMRENINIKKRVGLNQPDSSVSGQLVHIR